VRILITFGKIYENCCPGCGIQHICSRICLEDDTHSNSRDPLIIEKIPDADWVVAEKLEALSISFAPRALQATTRANPPQECSRLQDLLSAGEQDWIFLDEDMVPVPPLLASTLVAAARHGCFPRAQIVDLTQFQYNLANPDYDSDDDTNSGQADEGETLDASEDDSARRPEDNDAMSPIAAVAAMELL
jgi:hypothetical protein